MAGWMDVLGDHANVTESSTYMGLGNITVDGHRYLVWRDEQQLAFDHPSVRQATATAWSDLCGQVRLETRWSGGAEVVTTDELGCRGPWPTTPGLEQTWSGCVRRTTFRHGGQRVGGGPSVTGSP